MLAKKLGQQSTNANSIHRPIHKHLTILNHVSISHKSLNPLNTDENHASLATM